MLTHHSTTSRNSSMTSMSRENSLTPMKTSIPWPKLKKESALKSLRKTMEMPSRTMLLTPILPSPSHPVSRKHPKSINITLLKNLLLISINKTLLRSTTNKIPKCSKTKILTLICLISISKMGPIRSLRTVKQTSRKILTLILKRFKYKNQNSLNLMILKAIQWVSIAFYKTFQTSLNPQAADLTNSTSNQCTETISCHPKDL